MVDTDLLKCNLSQKDNNSQQPNSCKNIGSYKLMKVVETENIDLSGFAQNSNSSTNSGEIQIVGDQL